MTDILSLFDAAPYRLIVGALTGVTLGSFATMLSYRVPRRLSIIWPGSYCPACKTRLQPRDLVPLLSFAAQRGRCRFCGNFIGWRYVAIETALALAGAGAFVFFGFTLWLLIALTLIVASVTAIAIWLEHARATMHRLFH
jgi:leader peptidase (prepilin peptidase) / N-methyltransferase